MCLSLCPECPCEGLMATCLPYLQRLEERCSTNKIKLKSVIFQTPSPDAKAQSRTCRQPVPACSCFFLGATSYLWAVRDLPEIWARSAGLTVVQYVAFSVNCFGLPEASLKNVNQAVENQNKLCWNVVFPSSKICLKYIQIF